MATKNESASGEKLAKVLWYYNLIPNASTIKQKIVCPFHEDVNPSMAVDLEDGFWICFGCGLSGDAVKLVTLMEKKLNGLNDLKAYQKYLRILKSKKVSDVHLSAAVKKYKPAQKDMYLQAYDYYHGLAKVDWRRSEVPEVVQARGYMKNRGFSPKTLNKAKAKVTYNNSYGLIFPMLDNGKFKGWVCRTMIKDIEKKRKYLYNEGFSRATTLVGNYGAKNYVIVVEGYMDRLKFIQCGEDNVVAILGWKMSAQQIQKLKDAGIKCIVSALDNDECGRKGTEFLKKHFDVVRWSYLKGLKDPGDMTLEAYNKMSEKTKKSLSNYIGG